ncbi:purine-binding chemotaxis protein CheW [Archangium violaceum]|uniref:chemotaxis protein CheW n=1 Tax=Archangium violaceum TaxID=83451 RepID=UPI00195291E5|nr:chemotaxis protein CheW [Archangium violaceum]QRO01097.1 purine-binding chemotaxis protein CheW [Archangium violaceum]
MPSLSVLLDSFFYRPDEDVGLLQELVAGTDETVEPIPEEPPEEYLAFRLEEEHYAVPIREVREIVKVPPLTEVPRAAANLLGVMYLRGEVLPVYDVKVKLRLTDKAQLVAGPDAPEPPRRARIIVVQAEDGLAGLWVDSVSEVVRLRPSMLEVAPPGVGGGERDCVVGLGRRNQQLFILLDIWQALA